MSAQSKFKIKRPRSPDFIGIYNYKKQRLIEDLENLSIGDGPNLKSRKYLQTSSNGPIHEPSPIVDDLYLPYVTKHQALKLLNTDHVSSDDNSRLYSKLKELVRNEILQVVKWVDLPNLAYTQWVNWFRRGMLLGDNTLMGYKNGETITRQDCEGDIDMDT